MSARKRNPSNDAQRHDCLGALGAALVAALICFVGVRDIAGSASAATIEHAPVGVPLAAAEVAP